MKTPITYYGGKQKMLSVILPMIPEHSIYVEPFFGGGAVFWAKEPAQVEFINDINGEVANFYRVLQTDYDALKREVDQTLFKYRLNSTFAAFSHIKHRCSNTDKAIKASVVVLLHLYHSGSV